MKFNNRERLDLTEWIIHFIHDRKPEDDISSLEDIAELEGYTGDMRLPDYYDEYGNGKYVISREEENEYSIEEDAPALEVLKKILHDGYIKSGWSLRNLIPTIYGPKSAVCFTEMPLYALIDYAKSRETSGYVGRHGIAFRRNELYAAGARPVIYGLSSPYVETDKDEKGIYQGRLLSIKDTGIGIQEQYRYVSTNLTKEYNPKHKPIDWTHEREWRWALPDNKLSVPGLPFFMSKEYADFFSEIIIIVPSDDEMEEILIHLKTLYDAGGKNRGGNYNCSSIAGARVLSLESIAHFSNMDISRMRIDDLPVKQLKVMPNFIVDEKLEKKVLYAINEAGKIAQNTIREYLKNHPTFDENQGYWGWAYICTNVVSDITQALQNINCSRTYSDGIYRLNVNNYQTSNVELLEIGAEAAACYLSSELGQYFYVKTELD